MQDKQLGKGRKFFCFRFDGRRARNHQPYPMPECTTPFDPIRIKLIPVTEEESIKIQGQIRQQDRKLIRQKKEKQLRAQKLLHALLAEDVKNGL